MSTRVPAQTGDLRLAGPTAPAPAPALRRAALDAVTMGAPAWSPFDARCGERRSGRS